MDIRHRLVQFFKSAGKWGIGLMTGGIFAYLAAAWEHFQGKSITAYGWLVLGSTAMLLIGGFLAWDELWKKYEAAMSEIATLKKRYFEERPRIAFTVRSPKTNEEWQQMNNVHPPPIFWLEHYGGRAARFVKVDPILSSRSLFTMKFDEAASES